MPKHNIPPLWDSRSKILILGSFPSPVSQKQGFYYAHPQNRFWTILSKVFDSPTPMTIAERKTFCLDHNIAIWDVIGECEISGANDSSIANAVPNDLSLVKADIKAVFTTGKTATNLYEKFWKKPSIYLPSPSPANRAVSEQQMIESYSKIKEYL